MTQLPNVISLWTTINDILFILRSLKYFDWWHGCDTKSQQKTKRTVHIDTPRHYRKAIHNYGCTGEVFASPYAEIRVQTQRTITVGVLGSPYVSVPSHFRRRTICLADTNVALLGELMFVGQEFVVMIIPTKTITIIVDRTITPGRSGDVTAEGSRVYRGKHPGNRTLISAVTTLAGRDSGRVPDAK